MKTKAIALMTLALAGTLFTAGYLRGDTLTTNPTSDLMLVFHPSGGTGAGTDYLVDLGSYNNFATQAPGTTVSLLGSGGIQLGDLSTKFGAASMGAASTSSWDNRTAASIINWAVVGATGASNQANAPRRTVFGTSTSNQAGLGAGIPTASQTGPSGAINTWVQSLGGSTTTSDASVNGANGSTNAAYDTTGSFTSASGGSSPYFGGFNDPPFLNTTNVANGSVFSELYEFTQTTNAAPNVIDLGHFTLSNNNFTFTAAATAIPEPSTVGLFAGGIGVVLMAIRRRKAAKTT